MCCCFCVSYLEYAYRYCFGNGNGLDTTFSFNVVCYIALVELDQEHQDLHVLTHAIQRDNYPTRAVSNIFFEQKQPRKKSTTLIVGKKQ